MEVKVRYQGAVIKGRLLRLEDSSIVCTDGKRIGRFDVLIEPMTGIKSEIKNVPEGSIEICKTERYNIQVYFDGQWI